VELFTRADVSFAIDADWCAYLYMNGIIDTERVKSATGITETVCRFSSPFVQHKLYNALTRDLVKVRTPPISALAHLDTLSDVFDASFLDLPALLGRYKDYLKRLKSSGINPWKEQPRRDDLHLTEAVGHFHLYAWLKEAVEDFCVVSPEFPTGNGKVDLHLRCGEKQGIIEVKSFRSASRMKKDHFQAARYAGSLGFDRVTLVVFVPTHDETVLEKLSGEEIIEEVTVTIIAIGWG
jgi:hypothetical protein